jgi:hypothetical protein
MKVNQFRITDNMAKIKANLPEFTWDDIVKCGLSFCRIIASEDNSVKYNKLYYLSKIDVKKLMASYQ